MGSDMLRILIAPCIVSLIQCQQDYYGGESPQPYQAPEVYNKPAQQDSPEPYQAPYQAPKVYNKPPQQDSPKPYQAPYQAPKASPSQVGGMGDGGAPRPYGQGYLPQ